MRGTTNGNARGNSNDRAARRKWLVDTFRADTVIQAFDTETHKVQPGLAAPPTVVSIDACRCYRCGTLLTVDTVTVDRIIPGCRGGTYRRNNIRPACGSCNSVTGGGTRS